MSITTTTKEVSSPYAMFTSSELESLKGKINIDESSLIGIFPYVPFEIASNFVSKDVSRYLLQGIHIRVTEKNISIESTDGHRAFIFTFPNNSIGFKGNKNIIIPGTVFKTKVKNATKIIVSEDLISFMNDEIFLHSVAFRKFEGTFPSIDQIVPDTFKNNWQELSIKGFHYNAKYLKEFSQVVEKFNKEKCITFKGNNNINPFMLSTSWDVKNPFEDLDGFNAEFQYLLMPIQKRY